MEASDIKLRKKPSKVEEMTKEQLRQAILKKRECNATSQYIVESLLEKGIAAKYLLECLPDINQSHFEDIIEERSILRLCGYPICENKLCDDNFPKQKYRISVKTNKVYDITVRKSFCSNTCYKSAMHVKKQMLTSPLWFREYEEIPSFHLLPIDSIGSMGLEVDFSLVNQLTSNTKHKAFTSINEFAKASFNEITHEDDNIEEHDFKSDNIEEHDLKSDNIEEKESINTDNRCLEKERVNRVTNNELPNVSLKKDSESKSMLEASNIPNSLLSKEKKTIKNPLSIVGEVIEIPEKKIDPIILNAPISVQKENTTHKENKRKTGSKKQPIISDLTLVVEKCLADWFTLDTLLFLFGEAKVKDMVADKGKVVEEFFTNYQTSSIFYKSNAYDQYQALCRKLNMLELEERKHDAQVLQKVKKPLPDYNILKEESKKIKFKVKAYFSGETDIPELETEQKNNEVDQINVTHLPLVDKKAQNALRRKIVCQQLNKILPDLLNSLKLENLTITSDIRLLVNTFKLKPNNIMFKPLQWTLIAMIFVKLLSIRDARLCHMLETPSSYQNMQLLLLSFRQDGAYLNRLIIWLTHIDRLLNTHEG